MLSFIRVLKNGFDLQAVPLQNEENGNFFEVLICGINERYVCQTAYRKPFRLLLNSLDRRSSIISFTTGNLNFDPSKKA